jgi:hypothetical protein
MKKFLERLEAYSFLGYARGHTVHLRRGAERQQTGRLAHRLILSLDPERRKNRLANTSVRKTRGIAWFL